jgi:3-deoxy-D-manno-octulosonic-acid transferase
VPVDRPVWVNRFLDHWRPDVAMWVEQELWPNLVLATQARGVPMVLLNARMSQRSFARWQRLRGLGARMLRGFSLVMAQDEIEADRLRALGAGPVTTPGNLKFAAGPLPHDAAVLAAFRAMQGDRPTWVASSTHEGEEEIAGYVHKRVAQTVAGLLTVIVPRHPARGPAIAQKLRREGLRVARRGAGEPVTTETDLYVADTLGELGLFYRAASVAFIGGSLIPHGGQNILEPARLGAAVLHGPHMENFRAIVEEMSSRGATHEVADAEELVKALDRLLGDAALCDEVAGTAKRLAAAKDSILDQVAAQLEPVLGPVARRQRDGEPASGPAASTVKGAD